MNADVTSVTKEFTFDCAHMLEGHPGLCRNLHGHTYKLCVTVSKVRDLQDDMVVDFSNLKEIVTDKIISRFDHAVILNTNSKDVFEQDLITLVQLHNKKWVPVKYRPTAENMIEDFHKELFRPLKDIGVSIQRLRLYETPTNYAEMENIK